jgi:predicted CopG family antitoxin
MESTISLTDEIRSQMEETARAEGKTFSEVMQEAAERYLNHRGLDRLLERGRFYASRSPYTSADVPRLVREIRSEPGR